jgi:hypothetical protein
MPWLDQTLDELATMPSIGYFVGSSAAAEPTALAALAFSAHGRAQSAASAANALAKMQQDNGEVAVRAGEDSPGWPTSLAVSALCAIDRVAYRAQIQSAVNWLLTNRGHGIEQSDNFAHNTQLIGWAYAEQTHSWVEPTSFAVLALKAAGKGDDPATREGVAVLIDRQLPGGGLNYGNTFVLGQLIRSHVAPTGIALIALAGENDPSGRIAKSVAWLQRNLGEGTTPISLGWGLIGLVEHGVRLPASDAWLAAAADSVRSRDRSPHKLALLALAAKGWPT